MYFTLHARGLSRSRSLAMACYLLVAFFAATISVHYGGMGPAFPNLSDWTMPQENPESDGVSGIVRSLFIQHFVTALNNTFRVTPDLAEPVAPALPHIRSVVLIHNLLVGNHNMLNHTPHYASPTPSKVLFVSARIERPLELSWLVLPPWVIDGTCSFMLKIKPMAPHPLTPRHCTPCCILTPCHSTMSP